MEVCIHRGTHQIGGIATEIRTERARIIIDMGDELSTEPGFAPSPLDIAGVTDGNGKCDAVLLTHYHGDHVGQMERVRPDIPIYAGPLAKDIMLKATARREGTGSDLCRRIEGVRPFQAGISLSFGDIRVTPYCIDHSACDSYMFLIEVDGRRVLYTGDFRLHGIRRNATLKVLERAVRKVDAVITEGTTASRSNTQMPTEWDLQRKLSEYLAEYKYVLVLCSTTNLDRIFAFARAVPRGRYCVCDSYQASLVEAVAEHWEDVSSFYSKPKLTVYGPSILRRFQERGGLMFVRANSRFEGIIRELDRTQTIMLYSMWDGHRTQQGSKIPDFLDLAGRWEPLHTSGHASPADISRVVDTLDPEYVIPMHTDAPQAMQDLLPDRKVVLIQDRERFTL